MPVDNTINKKVIEDWQLAFPQLTKFAQNKLYKIIGPTVIGIELIKLPHSEEYRPHFFIYPLWEINVAKSLDIPIVLLQYYNHKNLLFNIPYNQHSNFFSEVIDSVNKQTPLPFANDVSLKKFMSVLNACSKMPPLHAAPNSYSQALLYVAKLKIALYVGVNEAEEVLDEIIKRDWDTKSFKNWNVDIIDWFQSLHEIIADRDNMMKQIEMNRQDKKIAKLQSSELIP